MKFDNIRVKKQEKGKIILIFTFLLIILIVFISLFYYSKITKSEDPRIAVVKSKYLRYSKLVNSNDISSGIVILDSIDAVYQKFSDYKNSFETGILQNSKAVNLITLAHTVNDDSLKMELLDSAKFCILKSIQTFESWISEYSHLSRNEIIMKINAYYDSEDTIYSGKNIVDVINKRADDIVKAQKETVRQQSIAYTNLGTIYQYMGNYKLAIEYNKKALEIWNDNKTAKNNVAHLFNLPVK